MSGTSLDAIDAVLVRCGKDIRLLASHSHSIPSDLRAEILALCQPGENEVDRAGPAHIALGSLFADATLALLEGADVAAADIHAIGCHGQTIRHRPGKAGFTVQIGSADVLAVRTGISVVSDFRNRDMALGGQGAPLVPAFHKAMWGQHPRCAIVNIGGMANITCLDMGGIVNGFDTGPGNVLMDYWAQKRQHMPFDRDGAWATSGQVQHELLARLLDEPYFSAPPPKSTGRELFNGAWLEQHLDGQRDNDIQATLLELTATSIARALAAFSPAQVLVCGGGAHNSALMHRLQALMESVPVTTTDDAGMPADWVEAAAFAWLAWARLNGVTGNAIEVTGASRPAILGAVYLP
ncbi:anhydro-N-acetylmuramic acid kinase [Alcanivorax sp. 1008]|uniref:anhydro-N-acetylmuramic acid kinase n=1 Tax=Alcanivorax sp. 1008 TaxID=2816853 RepID=UPI001E5AC078|nr:anhydro-N-acetylmuramic acid kinase [Alcanivorax sp. 1008]